MEVDEEEMTATPSHSLEPTGGSVVNMNTSENSSCDGRSSIYSGTRVTSGSINTSSGSDASSSTATSSFQSMVLGSASSSNHPLNLSSGVSGVQDEPLDMSMATSFVPNPATSPGHNSGDTLVEQQETYRESDRTSQLTLQQRQAMLEFFPDIQPNADPDPLNMQLQELPVILTPPRIHIDTSYLGSQRASSSPVHNVRKAQPSSKEEDGSPQAKFSRSSATLLLHPSLRNLGHHDLAVALLRQDKLEVSLNLKQECIDNYQRDPTAKVLSKVIV